MDKKPLGGLEKETNTVTLCDKRKRAPKDLHTFVGRGRTI